MEATKRYPPEPTSAAGDFFVEHNCCTSCGVPQVVAPDLVGWVEEPLNHCFWKKQPESPGELERAFKIFDGQELGCHRYAGSDPEIQKRVGYDQCDNPLSRNPFSSEYWGGRVRSAADHSERPSLLSRVFRRNRS